MIGPTTTLTISLQRPIVAVVAAMLKEERRTEFGEVLDFHDSQMEGRNT
jgi:hypothetical protein